VFINEEERLEILTKADIGEYDNKYFRYKKEEKELLDRMPKNLNEAFALLKKEKGITFKELSQKTGLCERTLIRLEKNNGRKIDFRTLVLVCLEMNLFPMVSLELFRLSSINLEDGSIRSNVIKEMLFCRRIPVVSKIEKAFSLF